MGMQKITDADKIKFQKRTIRMLASLLITGAVFFIILFIKSNGDFLYTFLSPDPTDDAPDKVESFRRQWTLHPRKSFGVYYDRNGFNQYLNKFEEIKKATASDAVNNGTIDTVALKLKWIIGCYWMMKKDDRDGKLKHDFCLVPTLVSTDDPTDVKDYFDPKNDQYYNHQNDTKPGLGNAYDQGTLFP